MSKAQAPIPTKGSQISSFLRKNLGAGIFPTAKSVNKMISNQLR
jgi:hypothetical protein